MCNPRPCYDWGGRYNRNHRRHCRRGCCKKRTVGFAQHSFEWHVIVTPRSECSGASGQPAALRACLDLSNVVEVAFRAVDAYLYYPSPYRTGSRRVGFCCNCTPFSRSRSMTRLSLPVVAWISMIVWAGQAWSQELTVVGPANPKSTTITTQMDRVPAVVPVHNQQFNTVAPVVEYDGYVPGSSYGTSCCGVDFGPLWASYCADKQRCRHCNIGHCGNAACGSCAIPTAPCHRSHRWRLRRSCTTRVRLQETGCDFGGCDGSLAAGADNGIQEPINLGSPPATPTPKTLPKTPPKSKAPKKKPVKPVAYRGA